MTKVSVCKVYSKLLEESKVTVMFERNGKQFFGPLFCKKDIDDRITRYYESIEVEASSEYDEIVKVIDAYIEACKKYGIKYFDTTPKTMEYWQYINGFSNVIFD